MGDSDDEYDRKRRDKFRGERSSGDNYRSDRRNDDRSRGRDEWADRGRGGRPDYRDYRRDRFSPERGGPPVKRMRNDWPDDGRPRYGHDPYIPYGGGGGWNPPDHYPMHGHPYGGGGGHGPLASHARGAADNQNNQDLPTQPAMLTLKQFLATQDDSISDSDAIAKYNDYKLDFKRQQLNEFFVTHKDEEWFKMKYHPEESSKRKEEQLNFLKNRASIFDEVLKSKLIESVSVDTTQTDQLLRLLDVAVIKLEGGTDEDLKVLDQKPIEVKPMESKPEPVKLAPVEPTSTTEDETVKPRVNPFARKSEKDEKKKSNDEEDNWEDDAPASPDQSVVKSIDEEWGDAKEANKKITSNDEEWDGESIQKPATPKDIAMDSDSESTLNREPNDSVKKSPEPAKKRSRSDSSSSSSSSSDSEDDERKSENGEPPAVKVEPDDDPEPKGTPDEDEKMNEADEKVAEEEGEVVQVKIENDEDEKKDEEDKVETIDLDKESDHKEDEPGPKALHKTSSIFLRNLAPTITKAEVEAMCKRYNGFLRVAIADPLVERRWFRRGWVTFQRDVNIKEICWNLNNIRLRDCELGAIVNRDLSRRVRPVNGITAHKGIVRSDIKLCAKIAYNLDAKSKLWQTESDATANGNKLTFGLNSNNPVLQNITDYLIEEASAEEDELLGLAGGDAKDSEGEVIERDPELISVLDKLILYMRIVHSVDFYNHCEYPYEDEMPNRLGIIHARGPAPQNKVTSNEIQEYIRNFENKMSSFLAKNQPIDVDELKKLGCKDTDAEVEKFIQANTQELAKDKWLCPLSGKKFKGPDFIRKHIFNKHIEKVDEVKKEVEYFNNYLKDPKRPQLPEHPGNNRKPPPEAVHQPPGYRPAYMGPMYPAPYAYAPPMVVPPRPRGAFGNRRGGGGGGGGEYRPIIHYRDLDAPREPDDFL